MAHSLEQLARQEQTLDNIRGIVATMKALAAINLGPYERAVASIEAYHRTILQGFSAFAFRMRGEIQPERAPVQHQVIVAFGSDHGFCGNYNGLVARALQTQSHGKRRQRERLLCVGARLQRSLEESDLPVDQYLTPPASVEGIGRLASNIVTRIEGFAAGQSLARLGVQLAHVRRDGHGGRVALVSTLLPLDPALLQAPSRWPSRALPDFSLPPAVLLSALLRNHIFASVFRASAETVLTENAARLSLMQQAEQSVSERLGKVRLELAGVRQDEITHELMDIVIGHMG
ncbi:MAG: F0F1 ATP synthase subunit gamma [Gammaproteobacteria bacterium]|nr:F0F1 ATP synthase subunit gamma [Gammaproteobacteria bacterium]